MGKNKRGKNINGSNNQSPYPVPTGNSNTVKRDKVETPPTPDDTCRKELNDALGKLRQKEEELAIAHTELESYRSKGNSIERELRNEIISALNKECEAKHTEAGIEAGKIIEQAKAEAKALKEKMLLEYEAARRLKADLDARDRKLAYQEEDVQYNMELWKQSNPARIAELESKLQSWQEGFERMNKENAELQKLVVRINGKSPEELIRERDEFRNRVIELEERLAIIPSSDQVESWKIDAAKTQALLEKNNLLTRRLEECEDARTRLSISCKELEQAQLISAGYEVLNDLARKELKELKQSFESPIGSRFEELLVIDKAEAESVPHSRSNKVKTLKELAEHVWSFAAGAKLYYTKADIRAFLAGMASSKLIILQGLSGTGKTSLAKVFMESIGGKYALIPVQSSWRDRYELLGYNNDFNKKFTETEFTKSLYKAGLPSQEDTIWTIVLDEMNLARIEYYFADFLSLLEEADRNKWVVPLISKSAELDNEGCPKYLLNGNKLKVTGNIWFVGTANKDQSTFEITDKVYDRAGVLEFRDRQKSDGFNVEPKKPLKLTIANLDNLFEDAVKSGVGVMDGNRDKIEALDNILREDFSITFGNRISDQIEKFIPVYVAAGGDEKYEAIDYILASDQTPFIIPVQELESTALLSLALAAYSIASCAV